LIKTIILKDYKMKPTKMKYYPQHMHIHSIYEPGSSMEGHMYFAALQGMKHIWFTEHDVFWNRKPISFGFESSESDENGALTKSFSKTCGSTGEVEIDNSTYYEGTSSMRLTATQNTDGDWRGTAAINDGKSFCMSLCQKPIFSFAHRAVKHSDGDVRYIFDLCLSERAPDQRFAHILFVCGDTDGLDAPHTLIVPISVGEQWQYASYDLAALASSEEAVLASVGGMDNVLSFFTVRVETRRGASASLFVDSVSVEGRTTAEQTKKNQTDLALEIGKKYGVTPFVTAEISAGGHKNCFSTDTPVFKYGDPDHVVTNEDACREMQRRGQVFAINHPFVFLKKTDPSTTDYNAECDALIDKLAKDNAYGASLLEVAFPFGRYAPYETLTRLWDGLAKRGVILTGHGATDSHMMTEGWFSGNNFASFIGVDAEREPSEQDFADAMRKGQLYAANPLVMKGDFSFTADGFREMGSVNIVPAGTKARVSFSVEISNHNWKVAWVVNGERVRLDRTTRMGYTGEYELETSGKIDFVRAEIYDYFGTLLLMTNPIYFTADIENIKNDVKKRLV